MKTAAEMKTLLQNNGYRFVSMEELTQILDGLGYTTQADMSCTGTSRFLTGPLQGIAYTEKTLSVIEKDTGLSFANVGARRDSKFKELQELRAEVFSVAAGKIVSL